MRAPTPVERCPRAPAPLAPVAREPSVVSIASCTTHECAVFRDGSVRCRGNNSYGQLGWGTRESGGVTPREVVGLHGVREVLVEVEGATAEAEIPILLEAAGLHPMGQGGRNRLYGRSDRI